ncbi:reverse transcriptase domain-containing protein [Tanacetum coccineum]
MFMLGPKPLSVYDQQLKHGLGYPNPYTLKQAISQCPKLYLASSLGNSEISLNVRDTEDTLDDASKSQQKVYEKMNDPIAVANKQNCWTIDYAQINALYKDFVPQKELSAEQKYFPSSFIPSDKNSNATPSIPASMPKEPIPGQTIVAMADRTMEELLRAPTEGYGEAIVLPEINADHFEIKTNLLQLVQANPFHGLENENPHAHINSFKRITSTLRFRNVPNDVIKLMMFPYSLEGAAKTWYEKEPPNSILTWDDLVTKFVNQFFPPSKTTHLKNKISRFSQEFDESFSEAWERFKGMLRSCPHHGFSELTQVDTFYNGLTENEQDSLNAAAGGNLLSKTTREALNIIENKSKVRYSRNKTNASKVNSRENVSKTDERIDKLADQLSTLVEIVSKKVVTLAPVKAVEKNCYLWWSSCMV